MHLSWETHTPGEVDRLFRDTIRTVDEAKRNSYSAIWPTQRPDWCRMRLGNALVAAFVSLL